MSQLKQEGVVDGRVPSSGILTTRPNPPAVVSTQPTESHVPAPLAEAVRGLPEPTPLASHAPTKPPASAESTLALASARGSVSRSRASDDLQYIRQTTSHDVIESNGTGDLLSPDNTGIVVIDEVAAIPIDTSISIDERSVGFGATIESALVVHTTPAVSENIQRLPPPTSGPRPIGQATLAVFRGEPLESQPLGWDPFEEEYPATASAPLNRVATPALQEIPSEIASQRVKDQQTSHTPRTANVVRFREDGLSDKTATAAMFRPSHSEPSETAHVAFVSSDGRSDGAANNKGARLPDHGAATIRFADSEQSAERPLADNPSSVSPNAPRQSLNDEETTNASSTKAGETPSSGWKPIRSRGAR